jgi:hypothetical protein
MDILSHGLWATAAAKAVGRKIRKPLDLRWAFFWGVFPDLFAFGLPFIWMLWSVLTGQRSFSDFPRPEHGEPPAVVDPIFRLAPVLYNFSHSFVIFALVLAAVLLLNGRKPVWAMIGWPLHILMDIPTHSYRFYPTPFLWPISGLKFDGFSWGVWWFMVLNYSALAMVFILLRYRRPAPKT